VARNPVTITARLATTWTWLYTFPLARATRDRRRAEIRNDLAEQSRDGRIDARRVLLGMPADLGWMAGRLVADRVASRVMLAVQFAAGVGAIWVNNHAGRNQIVGPGSPGARDAALAIPVLVLLALIPFRRHLLVRWILATGSYADLLTIQLVGAWPLITHPDVAALPWLSVAALAGVILGGRLPGYLWPGTR
jgi:hypothetical protein